MGSTEEAYQLYLARFDKAVGAVEVGQYGKHEGKLVKKLSRDEFAGRWKELVDLRTSYERVLEGGQTISNVLMKLLRERSNELIVEPPKDFTKG